MLSFGLGLYGFIWGLCSLRRERIGRMRVPRMVKTVSVLFLLLVPALFSSLWVSQLLTRIRRAEKLEFTYGVYILDLCLVMPLFLIAAVMLVRDEGMGYMLAPILFIKGFTVLLPVGVGGLLTAGSSLSETAFYLGMAALFLVLTALYLKAVRMMA